MIRRFFVIFAIGLLFLYIELNLFTLMTLLAAVVHEVGHFVAIRGCGTGVKQVKILGVGADIRLTGRLLSYKKSLVIALSGVIANFLLAVVFFWVAEVGSYGHFFAIYNLMLGAFNLFPIKSLDGGEALACLLYMGLPISAAEKIAATVSNIALFLLWTLSVYLLIWNIGRVSLLLLCGYLFLNIEFRQLK
ncbi:MAG: site-2 protease family protein [Oscillospiraceae bacterium]|nr:site-2 protease family protein [Oscillospiraceae bacterium]